MSINPTNPPNLNISVDITCDHKDSEEYFVNLREFYTIFKDLA